MTEVVLQIPRLSVWKIMKLAPSLIPLCHTKINSIWIKDLNRKNKTFKLVFQENKECLYDRRLGKTTEKIEWFNSPKIRNSCSRKDTIKEKRSHIIGKR